LSIEPQADSSEPSALFLYRRRSPHLCTMSLDKHNAAKTLYFEGWSQKDIASTLRVTEKTVSAWKRKAKWDEERARDTQLRDTASDEIMKLINFQIRVLNRIKDTYEEQLEEASDLKELNSMLIDKGQIDALYKMFAAVKGKEITWAAYVRISRELMQYVSSQDIALAKALHTHADDFLNMKRKDLA